MSIEGVLIAIAIIFFIQDLFSCNFFVGLFKVIVLGSIIFGFIVWSEFGFAFWAFVVILSGLVAFWAIAFIVLGALMERIDKCSCQKIFFKRR